MPVVVSVSDRSECHFCFCHALLCTILSKLNPSCGECGWAKRLISPGRFQKRSAGASLGARISRKARYARGGILFASHWNGHDTSAKSARPAKSVKRM
jgi:hypothetical protein